MGNLNILLAEDNLVGRKIAGKLLESAGCNVDFAENGREAVEKALASKYDLVFMDMIMPEMDGSDASIEIRKNGVQTPIIALSANVLSKEELEKSGMNDSIVKPLRKDELVKLLGRYGHEI